MKRSWVIIAIIVAVLVIGLGIFIYEQQQPLSPQALQQQLQTSSVLPKARQTPSFQLTDTQGNSFTSKNLQGHWSMMFFGYTNCPHLCPMTMSELTKAYQLLQKQNVRPPQVYMATIDPKRDTLKRLRHYVKGFNKQFKGLRANKQNIDAFSKKLGVVWMKQNKSSKNDEDYDINHSGTIFLFNPQGQLQAFFSTPHQGKQIAHDFKLIKRNIH